MAQITIYLPKELEKTTRQKARRARKSLSAYIASVLQPAAARPKVLDSFGSIPGLRVPDDADLAPLDEP